MLSESRESLEVYTWLWVGLMVASMFLSWSSRRPSVGLPLGYVFALSLIHFSGALAYVQPNYRPLHPVLVDNHYSLHTTFLGFEMALLGLAGLLAGFFIANLTVGRVVTTPVVNITPANQKIPGTLWLVALVSFFVLLPVLQFIPSVGNVGLTATGLSVVAVCLTCWNAWLRHQHRRIFLWLLFSSAYFPFFSLFFSGFTSFGVASATVVWVFVMSIYRPRWVVLLSSVLLMYLGYTAFVNYMRERNSIRASVWGNQDSSQRLDRMYDMVRYFQWFSLKNNFQLEAIDARLNQNHLVGMGIDYIGNGNVDFSKGETLIIAATAWVPRIIWPNKPTTAGSGGIVSRYTGMKFEAGTSVGVGQVLEFYINFGAWFVFAGFVGMGFVLRWFDIRAATYLMAGDYVGFSRWIVPAIGLLSVGTNTATLVASTASGAVLSFLLDRTLFARYLERPGGFAMRPRRAY